MNIEESETRFQECRYCQKHLTKGFFCKEKGMQCADCQEKDIMWKCQHDKHGEHIHYLIQEIEMNKVTI